MTLSVFIYLALLVFLGGLLWRASRWFRGSLRRKEGGRLPSAIKGIVGTLFSPRLLILLKALILDVILQRRTFREDRFRWVMHILIYWGFILLILMHALGRYLTVSLFEDYLPTLNPFLFLRDLFGAMVLLGALMAAFRRWMLRIPRLISSGMDLFVILFTLLIILSGFLLQGVKITSQGTFEGMVREYAEGLEEEELRVLKAYWVKEFGVVIPGVKGEVTDLGRGVHEESCAGCHSPSRWAFLSYGVSRGIAPIAPKLDKAGFPKGLFFVHLLAVLLGLALLPFTKFLHLVTSPLSLLLNAVMERGRSTPANLATKQMIELDACTHCGTCTVRCSMAPLVEEVGNLQILPSEKIQALKALASGRDLPEDQLHEILEGVHLCTNCYRCTVTCPVGINLQDLWFEAKEALFSRGLLDPLALSPLSFFRGLMKEEVGEGYETPITRIKEVIEDTFPGIREPGKEIEVPAEGVLQEELSLSVDASTFYVCFGCQTCTNACPVVAQYEEPQEVLGMLPHQIMHACALGLKDLALGSKMLWDCLTCYQCQEQCPQGVQITDVFYELKGMAAAQLRGSG